MLINPSELADRYASVWNQPDPEQRRKAIAELWTEDGVQFLQPPQEVREAAARLGLTPILEACGHGELEVRVTRSYEEFVAPGKFVFKPRDNAARLGNVVKFNWEMVPTDGGEQPAPAWRSSSSTTAAGSGSTTSSSRDERDGSMRSWGSPTTARHVARRTGRQVRRGVDRAGAAQ